MFCYCSAYFRLSGLRAPGGFSILSHCKSAENAVVHHHFWLFTQVPGSSSIIRLVWIELLTAELSLFKITFVYAVGHLFNDVKTFAFVYAAFV